MLGRWPVLLREPHQIALPAMPRRTLDLEAATERLREQGEQVRSRLETMTKNLQSLFAASAGSNADDEHDPEGPTIAYERAQLSALIEAAREDLAAIEAATHRLNHSGYGICEVCHQPIPVPRLDARPTARTCLQHAAPGRR